MRGHRRRRRELPPGHNKCSLRDELEQDRQVDEDCKATFNHKWATLAAAYAAMLVVQPFLSALETIGRPRGEQWDFMEIYAGCGSFTAAVLAAGLVVGPSVDILPGAKRLQMNLLLESSQALLQAVLDEARPRWLHVGPPCTFWCAISRWTAHHTPEEWSQLRRQAKEHWIFALHMLRMQDKRSGKGSLEQPPKCVSWKLRASRAFMDEFPAWRMCKFPSCAYGMRDPVSGAPWKKMQCFLERVLAALVPDVHMLCAPWAHQG